MYLVVDIARRNYGHGLLSLCVSKILYDAHSLQMGSSPQDLSKANKGRELPQSNISQVFARYCQFRKLRVVVIRETEHDFGRILTLFVRRLLRAAMAAGRVKMLRQNPTESAVHRAPIPRGHAGTFFSILSGSQLSGSQ
jgi:hypothetical protein